MSKNELRFTTVVIFVIAIVSFGYYVENKTKVEYDKTYFNQATDHCKQEYIDYNLDN